MANLVGVATNQSSKYRAKSLRIADVLVAEPERPATSRRWSLTTLRCARFAEGPEVVGGGFSRAW